MAWVARTLSWTRRVQLLGGLAIALSGCVQRQPFECNGLDSVCADDGLAGVCTTYGWCAFPDAQCASGYAFGGGAGAGFGGQCVPEGAAESGSAGVPTPGTSTSADEAGSETTVAITSTTGESEGATTVMDSGTADGGTQADGSTASSSEADTGTADTSTSDAGGSDTMTESGDTATSGDTAGTAGTTATTGTTTTAGTTGTTGTTGPMCAAFGESCGGDGDCCGPCGTSSGGTCAPAVGASCGTCSVCDSGGACVADEGAACGTCQVCDAAAACVPNTGASCGTCAVCDGAGACVSDTNTPCGTCRICDNAKQCVITPNASCGTCQRCTVGGACSTSAADGNSCNSGSSFNCTDYVWGVETGIGGAQCYAYVGVLTGVCNGGSCRNAMLSDCSNQGASIGGCASSACLADAGKCPQDALVSSVDLNGMCFNSGEITAGCDDFCISGSYFQDRRCTYDAVNNRDGWCGNNLHFRCPEACTFSPAPAACTCSGPSDCPPGQTCSGSRCVW